MPSKVSLFAGAALLVAALPAAAQNLLTNPGFATDYTGWDNETTFITAAWQTVDATGQHGSGSVAITNTQPGLSNGLSQCVPVTPGASYDFGARVEIPAGQTGVDASVVVEWFAGATCSQVLSGAGEPEAELATPGDHFVGIQQTAQAAPAGARSAEVILSVGVDSSSSSPGVAYFDDAYLQPSGGCTSEATYLCLNNSRFKVAATYDAGGGNAGTAQVVTLTDDTGFLWFFEPSNVEVVVKMLNGCGLGGHYWFFAGGLTNVSVVITVTDTQTGATRTYSNPQGKAFQPLQDTAAFSTCP